MFHVGYYNNIFAINNSLARACDGLLSTSLFSLTSWNNGVCLCVCVSVCVCARARVLVLHVGVQEGLWFLGASAKFRKATVSFFMSVRPHGTAQLPLYGFFIKI